MTDRTVFEIRLPDGRWCGPFETTRTTSSRVYFFSSEMDGDNLHSRRMSWLEWWSGIYYGSIRFPKSSRYGARRIKAVAKERIESAHAADAVARTDGLVEG